MMFVAKNVTNVGWHCTTFRDQPLPLFIFIVVFGYIHVRHKTLLFVACMKQIYGGDDAAVSSLLSTVYRVCVCARVRAHILVFHAKQSKMSKILLLLLVPDSTFIHFNLMMWQGMRRWIIVEFVSPS